MKLYTGIDLHSNNSVVVISDENDKIVYQKRLSNDLGLIIQSLKPYQADKPYYTYDCVLCRCSFCLSCGSRAASQDPQIINTATIRDSSASEKTNKLLCDPIIRDAQHSLDALQEMAAEEPVLWIFCRALLKGFVVALMTFATVSAITCVPGVSSLVIPPVGVAGLAGAATFVYGLFYSRTVNRGAVIADELVRVQPA